MPKENRSSNTEMVSVPRESLRQFIEYSAGVCKSPAWVKDKTVLLAALDQPTEQHLGEPVAVVDESDDGLFIDFIYGENGNPLKRGDKLYNHPDAGEVERLRYKAELYDEVWELATGLGYMNVTTAIGKLSDQLAERSALLREWRDSKGMTLEQSINLIERIEAALSASAEPSNTVANTRDVKAAPIMLAAVANLVDAGDGVLEPRWLLEGGTAELFADTLLLVANKPDLCRLDGSAVVYAGAGFNEIERLRAMLRKIAGFHWANVDPEERARTRAELRDLLSASAEPNAHGNSQGLLDGSAAPVERDHEIPGTSFQRLNALANQGE